MRNTDGTAPGSCADCGGDAYIRLAGTRDTMICAHCFADRAGRGPVPPRVERPPAPAATPRGEAAP